MQIWPNIMLMYKKKTTFIIIDHWSTSSCSFLLSTQFVCSFIVVIIESVLKSLKNPKDQKCSQCPNPLTLILYRHHHHWNTDLGLSLFVLITDLGLSLFVLITVEPPNCDTTLDRKFMSLNSGVIVPRF